MIMLCIFSDFDKQIIFRASRLIQIQKFKFLRLIFWVLHCLSHVYLPQSVVDKSPVIGVVTLDCTKGSSKAFSALK